MQQASSPATSSGRSNTAPDATRLQGAQLVLLSRQSGHISRQLQRVIGWQLTGQSLRASSRISVASLSAVTLHHPVSQFHGGGPGWPFSGGDDGRPEGPGPQLLHTISSAAETVTLTLASFAVTKLAYVRLTKQFRDSYLQQTGVDVRFRLTFAGSGVQARAVIDGLPAELVALALPLDVDRIASAGLITPTWRERYPCKSTVCETTVALVVRQGNPKNIQTWSDLIKSGVEVVLANPKTAGVARWIFLALWGSVQKGWRRKIDFEEALEYVKAVFANVVVQPRDAREASDVFYKQRVGDVLLTYENEVVLTNAVYGSKALPYVIPPLNVRIECPISLVDSVVQSRDDPVQKAADEFAKFLFTSQAQREFAKLGFRANPKVSKVAAEQQVGLPPAKLWSVDDVFGGWDKAQKMFFDAGKILDEIQEEVGKRRVANRQVATAKK